MSTALPATHHCSMYLRVATLVALVTLVAMVAMVGVVATTGKWLRWRHDWQRQWCNRVGGGEMNLGEIDYGPRWRNKLTESTWS